MQNPPTLLQLLQDSKKLLVDKGNDNPTVREIVRQALNILGCIEASAKEHANVRDLMNDPADRVALLELIETISDLPSRHDRYIRVAALKEEGDNKGAQILLAAFSVIRRSEGGINPHEIVERLKTNYPVEEVASLPLPA